MPAGSNDREVEWHELVDRHAGSVDDGAHSPGHVILIASASRGGPSVPHGDK